MRHVLYSQQFNRSILDGLFRRADEFRRRMTVPSEKLALTQLHCGKTLFSVFYEPSTRTRMSFSAAAQHLGMSVVATENAREFSSAIKGESLEDTIRVLCEYYPDVIALRHYEIGAAERAARYSSVPIINAKFDGNRLLFVAPETLRMGSDIKEHLEENGVAFAEESSLEAALPQSDVVYWTRVPQEVDADPRAWYFRQAGNGMFIRMSLLEWIFEGD